MKTPKRKASLLLIYTGGTIGMKQDPEDGTLKPFDFSGILEEVPELSKFALRIDAYTFDPLIDSSDVEPASWIKLAHVIRERYDEYDGFIVLHGTDTMAYSASALSFMLVGLAKPVVFTGSQLPIGVPRTDGKENLISAVEIAASLDEKGRPLVPEVSIFFDSHLLRGNRATKVSSEDFNAFQTPNCPVLADAGIEIRYNRSVIRPAPARPAPLEIRDKLDTRVSILKLHPGITPAVVRYFLLSPETRAVILETYGSGNAPSRPWFLDTVREADRMGKILVNVTQCQAGSVNMRIYANGKRLEDAGVVSGWDSTTESALGKLFVLLGQYDDNRQVKDQFQRNLCGEITL